MIKITITKGIDYPKLKDEFASLINDDEDFNYSKTEFIDWLEDYGMIGKCVDCGKKEVKLIVYSTEEKKYFPVCLMHELPTEDIVLEERK